MNHQPISGSPVSADRVNPLTAMASNFYGGNLPYEASPANALHLSPADSIALRQQAERELTVALQAAAERVRYITGASGVALALCETEEDEMVCHGASGPTAPEVGTHMQIQSGITAESVRTRQTLRCDQASTDQRVNQETCRALGIESVMVMPLIVGRDVVGMFELFGQRASAFGDRDAKTLQGTVSGVRLALERAVTAGFTLGRIPWAAEPEPRPEPITSTLPAAALSPLELPSLAEVALRVPVAFPVSAFSEAEEHDPQGGVDEERVVPAFLARLADEVKPASGKRWSQWFRPQW